MNQGVQGLPCTEFFDPSLKPLFTHQRSSFKSHVYVAVLQELEKNGSKVLGLKLEILDTLKLCTYTNTARKDQLYLRFKIKVPFALPLPLQTG